MLNTFSERTPLLGYYAEGHPTVMDRQITWAVEHGISFFVFDWYWVAADCSSSTRWTMAI